MIGRKLGTQTRWNTCVHWYNLDPEYPADYLNLNPGLYPENDVNYFFRTGVANTNNIRCRKQPTKHRSAYH